MRWNSFHISLDTLIAASPLMGHELEDRSPVRDSQEAEVARRLERSSSTPLRSPSQRDLFCVAPLDWLVAERAGQRQFHLLELNGTGIGGLTNLTARAVQSVLHSLTESCAAFDDSEGVVLMAVSGKESLANPRRNRLMHEKLLFVEALRRGLKERFGRCDAANCQQLQQASPRRRGQGPTVVLGYIKDFLNAATLDDDGQVWLHGRRAIGAVNDRFCRNLQHRFDDRVNFSRLPTLNRCFVAGSDKGVAYGLMNEFTQAHPQASLPEKIRFAHVNCRGDLIRTVRDWLAQGRQAVIKPQGTGLGHGIEFFLDAREAEAAIVARVDRSLSETEEFYGLRGGALPYTVCDFVDACRVQEQGHPLHGHKFELRVVVYRHGLTLRAFPSIAKIARERDDGGGGRRALINNITASGDTSKVNGVEYMLPLCNERTWAMLGLSLDEMETLGRAATGYVRHVLDRVEDCPEQFGLPVRRAGDFVPRLLAAA